MYKGADMKYIELTRFEALEFQQQLAKQGKFFNIREDSSIRGFCRFYLLPTNLQSYKEGDIVTKRWVL